MTEDNSRVSPGLGGRPRAVDRLGVKEEDIWNDIACGLTYRRIQSKYGKKLADPVSGRTSCEGLGIRTIARIAGRMPKDYQANFGDFLKVPGVANWVKRMKARNKESNRYYRIMREMWQDVWAKKPLEEVDDDDFTLAIEHIHESGLGEAHGKIALVRFWESNLIPAVDISNFRSELGWKRKVRVIPEIMSKAFFTEILPAIRAWIRQGVLQVSNGTVQSTIHLTPRQIDEMELTLYLKVAIGIRTGSRQAGRELWGTKVGGNDKDSRVALNNGKLVGMTVNAKKDLVCYIQPNTVARAVREMLEGYIAKYGIRSGEYLLQELTPSLANKALRGACQSLGITELRLHDLRKAFLTGLCLAGVRLEHAIDMGVGWRSIEVARRHYLMVGGETKGDEYSKFDRMFFNGGQTAPIPHEFANLNDEEQLEQIASILRQNRYTVEAPKTLS